MTRRFRLSVLVCAGMLAIPATRGGRAQPMEPTMSATDAVGQVITGHFRGPAGGRAWRLYVPSSYVRTTPPMLLVLLHGCTQTAADIARGSQMDQVAEERGFLVLYPEQPVEANPRTCWNWFDVAHQTRDAGEPAILAGLVADVLAQFPADPKRVHIAGISAGAAMAGLVAVAYPERFATLTSLSGVPWQAARNVGAAVSVMQRGAGDAVPSADAVLAGMGSHRRAFPVLVIHGGADAVVSFRNAEETATQWVGVQNRLRSIAGTAALQPAPEQVTHDNAYTVRRIAWLDDSGVALVTRVRIDELGHAWAGGSAAGTFTDAKGPDVSRMVAAFCEQHRQL